MRLGPPLPEQKGHAERAEQGGQYRREGEESGASNHRGLLVPVREWADKRLNECLSGSGRVSERVSE
ncbi:hypothetical protein GCM10010095_05360 [Streptomyces anthocyanicus]|nr:hypothetical protein SLITK23_11780 [Streptomyces lividans]GGL23147.1 hypothetical protein GCM10010095_05360 [Streptomyces anthocyanicus]